MRRYDVIYILKENAASYEELRYSLRSIEANMTHGDVWFYGGTPEDLVPDHGVQFRQTGASKWEKTRNTLLAICRDPDVPERFWLFNDDFFIMQRMTSTKAIYNETLQDHYKRIEAKRGGRSEYSKMLRLCEQQLEEMDLPTLDYALHVPMLIDKGKALEVLEAFPGCPMFRSLYGNYCKLGGTSMEDVKIVDLNQSMDPDALFVSTNNKSFRLGKVGKQIREAFPDVSRYEAEYNG